VSHGCDDTQKPSSVLTEAIGVRLNDKASTLDAVYREVENTS